MEAGVPNRAEKCASNLIESGDGQVRAVVLQVGTTKRSGPRYLRRPVQRIYPLEVADDCATEDDRSEQAATATEDDQSEQAATTATDDQPEEAAEAANQPIRNRPQRRAAVRANELRKALIALNGV